MAGAAVGDRPGVEVDERRDGGGRFGPVHDVRVPPEHVQVFIADYDHEHWAKGGTLAADR